MKALLSLVACGLSAAVVAGCSGSYDKPLRQDSPPALAQPADVGARPEPTNEPTNEPIDQPQPSEAVEAGPAATRSEPPARKNAAQETPAKPAPTTPPEIPPPPPPAPSSPPNITPIQLSGGVALPQSLPTGTAMGFSVDYQVAGGQTVPAAECFWVIQPAKGKAVKQPVRLAAQGTLQGFVPDLRPENGPFQTYIEDPSGARLSQPCPLR